MIIGLARSGKLGIHRDAERWSLRWRKFTFYWAFTSWAHISPGFHLDLAGPNIEVHLPFGFLRLGWQGVMWPASEPMRKEDEAF